MGESYELPARDPTGFSQIAYLSPTHSRAVQISGLVDRVALILLDKRVPQPVIAKSGWGEGAVDLETCCPSVLL
jgi:hypothetical protein